MYRQLMQMQMLRRKVYRFWKHIVLHYTSFPNLMDCVIVKLYQNWIRFETASLFSVSRSMSCSAISGSWIQTVEMNQWRPLLQIAWNYRAACGCDGICNVSVIQLKATSDGYIFYILFATVRISVSKFIQLLYVPSEFDMHYQYNMLAFYLY